MRIDILCSGSKGNCTLIRSGTTSILLDCGPSSVRYIKQGLAQAGSSMESLQAMLITHTHGDHIRQLRHFAWLPVYAPTDIRVRDPKKNPVPLSLHQIIPMIPFRIGGLLITPFSLSHDAGPTVGYVIADAYEKLVYLTDTGYVRNEILPFLRGADYYVVESNHDVDMLMHTNRPWSLIQRILGDSGHLNNEDSSRLLAKLITEQTQNVVLAHLSEEANTPEAALACFYETMRLADKEDLGYEVCCASQYETVTIGELDDHPVPVSNPAGSSFEKKTKPAGISGPSSNAAQTAAAAQTVSADPASFNSSSDMKSDIKKEEKTDQPATLNQNPDPSDPAKSADSPIPASRAGDINTQTGESSQKDSREDQNKSGSESTAGFSIPEEMKTTWAVFQEENPWQDDSDDLYADPLF